MLRRIVKRNQVVITALAVMLAVAGYLTYAGKQDLTELPGENVVKETVADYDTYVQGDGQDVAQVNAGADAVNGAQSAGISGDGGAQAADSGNREEIDSLDYDIEDPGEAVLASGMTVNDYLATARLAREQVRGKNREDLLKIIDDDTASEENRQAAVDKMVELTDNSDRENAAETLLSAKGFDHSIVSITDGKVDVVICKSSLDDAELAQIEDIVKRKANVSAAEIVISLMDING